MSSIFDTFFQAAPKVRPLLNTGCLFDIPTGKYIQGKHGESILNGGLSYITGIGGRGNSFKSVIMQYLVLCVLARYKSSAAQFHDTETSLTLQRLMSLAMAHDDIAGIDLEEQGRLHLSDNTVMSGNLHFDKLRSFGKEKQKNPKQWMLTTPFIDNRTGENIKAFIPTVSAIDSLSMLSTDSVETIYDKNQIGDSGANTDALRGSAAKSQMLVQLPSLTGMSGIYSIMTAHVGDKVEMDPYAPNTKKLTFLKGKTTFKNVPEKFTFLTNNLWYVLGVQVLTNKGTKAPEFPKDSSDSMEGDSDLQILQIMNLRAKSGPTGMPFELIVSQSEGVLASLSEFNYIRSFNRFGLGGNDRNYYLELVPDIGLSRTTIRNKINTHPKLRRAFEITSELCQMTNLWDDEEKLFCTPKELYDDLKVKGYDWELLLGRTRGYWVFVEDEKDTAKKFLSTMDLLRMRKNLYRPWWYDELVKSL